MIDNTADLLRDIEFKARWAQEAVDKFAAKLSQDPLYAFSWSADTIAAAARIKVYRQIAAALEHKPEMTIAAIRREAMTQALRAARYPAASTSAVHNLTEQQVAAAWAEVLETIGEAE